MKLVLVALLLGATFVCCAQQVSVFYLKNSGRYIANRDSADYVRIVSAPDSGSLLYNVAEYYKNGNKKTVGKSTHINPPRYRGQTVNYFENGNPKSRYQYGDKGAVGSAYEFYPNGKLYRQLKYPDSITTTNENHFAVNYLIVANLDSLGKPQITDGQGYYKGFDDKFAYINEEGPIKDGKRDGNWKGTEKNLKLTFTETYKDGALLSGNTVDSAGATFTYNRERATAPKFDGGLPAFGRFLGKNMVYPKDERRNEIEGIVILQFIVEKDGSISDIRIQRSVSPGLDAEAVRVLKKSPAWIPGTRFGKPVKVTYAVPINFKLQ
ncbi:energy transducer TonB [Mucilaginibacter pedocola]|uniref:TonB C-terminal domain-containing protein n=1 Tax=Mucilaginibacter pedocola TaxID=1792845 RepID=A0A1S9PL41_9SPHI|nr:energy transducer TonB [Mucilaginibacter pedocola]OOQ61258.1 hypothetical protein BC343_19915 [Mucilaginibacter pedocola]